MKFRGEKDNDGIKLDMTSMIDIVFQLLIFFIMTFKITSLEGDFDILMPAAGQEADPNPIVEPRLITVKLEENPATHDIQRITVAYNGESNSYEHGNGGSAFASLRKLIKEYVNDGSDPSSEEPLEVEIEADRELHYGDTIKAIEHITADLADDGKRVIPLVERIKLKDAI